MKNILYAVLVSLLLAACVSGVRYTPAEISGFSQEVQEHIRNAEVVVGMSRQAVRYAWGAPTEVNILEPDPSGKDREEWVYGKLFSRMIVIFAGDEVNQIVTKNPGAGSKEAKGPEPAGPQTPEK